MVRSYLAWHKVFLNQLLVVRMEHPNVKLDYDKYADEEGREQSEESSYTGSNCLRSIHVLLYV